MVNAQRGLTRLGLVLALAWAVGVPIFRGERLAAELARPWHLQSCAGLETPADRANCTVKVEGSGLIDDLTGGDGQKARRKALAQWETDKGFIAWTALFSLGGGLLIFLGFLGAGWAMGGFGKDEPPAAG